MMEMTLFDSTGDCKCSLGRNRSGVRPPNYSTTADVSPPELGWTLACGGVTGLVISRIAQNYFTNWANVSRASRSTTC